MLELQDGEQCVLIGTLYKEMKLKPSVLDEYSKDVRSTTSPTAAFPCVISHALLRQLSMPRSAVSSGKFVSEDDGLLLEDEGARVKLRGDALPVQTLCSGVVAALRGFSDGLEFEVTEVCFAQPDAQAALPRGFSAGADAAAPSPTAKYVALVSGLRLGGGADPMPAQMLLDWLTGNLGSGGEQALAARVVRLIVAGDCVTPMEAPTGNVSHKDASRLAGPLKEADALLAQLACALHVDLMPGKADPSNLALPQQPLHACLFPEACRYEGTLHRVTNPHECSVDGVAVLGTSGQNVDDLWRCTGCEERLDILASTLTWGHLAPSAPDTLSCYPFNDRDPFLVPTQPHLYFAGNQPEYASRLVADARSGAATRLLLVPAFAATGTLVLVNLETLACHPITFSAEMMAADA